MLRRRSPNEPKGSAWKKNVPRSLKTTQLFVETSGNVSPVSALSVFLRFFAVFFFYFFQRFFFRFLSRILRRILGRILGRLFFSASRIIANGDFWSSLLHPISKVLANQYQHWTTQAIGFKKTHHLLSWHQLLQ